MHALTYRSPKTEVKASAIQGRGLFAREAIAPGEIVAVKGGYVLPADAWRALEPTLGPAEIQISEDLVIAPVAQAERDGAMLYTNHSCEPNIALQGQIVFVAMRDIAPGEELTHDWATTDDGDYTMECRCGSPRCRGTITGKDWMDPALQARYRGWFCWFLQRKIDATTRRSDAMTTPALPPPLAIYRMATGHYVSSAVHVAAELGLADLLASGPRHHEDLARATGTHPPSLQRVLRLLASVGVVTEEHDGRFALTPIGESLRSGVPGSMRAVVRLFASPRLRQAWGDLLHSVRTGEPAYHHVFGTDSFSHMAAHPEEAAIFDEAMAGFTRQIAEAAVEAYDFSRFGTIVDVGGGNGALLAGILRATPGARGIVFEQPHAAERAREHLAELGLGDRCEALSGDFFREIPAGGDAYLLKHVIHDWDDERATHILKNCRRAMAPGATLLIVEGVYPPRIDQAPESLGAASNDVNMLVCTGGRQRSEPEFRTLLDATGFTLARIVPTRMRVGLIEGVPA